MSSVIKMKGLPTNMAQMTHDLASTLYTPEQVFETYGVSERDAKFLLQNEHFKEMLTAARQQWQAVGNTHKRVRAKALMLMEDALEGVFLTLTDPDTPASAKATLLKELRGLAGIDSVEEVRSATLPTVTIHLGNDAQPVNVSPRVIKSDVDDAECQAYDEPTPVPEVGLEDMIWDDAK